MIHLLLMSQLAAIGVISAREGELLKAVLFSVLAGANALYYDYTRRRK